MKQTQLNKRLVHELSMSVKLTNLYWLASLWLQFPICFKKIKSTQREIKSAQTWRCLMRNLQLFQLTRTGNKAEIPANATLSQLLYHLPYSKHNKLQNIAQQEPLNLTKIARWFSLFYFKVTRCALDEVEFCSFTWKFDEDRSSKWQASKPTSQNANNLTSQHKLIS